MNDDGTATQEITLATAPTFPSDGDDTDGGTSTDTDLAQTGVGVAIVVASRERSA